MVGTRLKKKKYFFCRNFENRRTVNIICTNISIYDDRLDYLSIAGGTTFCKIILGYRLIRRNFIRKLTLKKNSRLYRLVMMCGRFVLDEKISDYALLFYYFFL